jgi:hypothetical protein
MSRDRALTGRSNGIVRVGFLGGRRIVRPFVALRSVAIWSALATIARTIAARRRTIEWPATTAWAKLSRTTAGRRTVGTATNPRSSRRPDVMVRMMMLREFRQLDEFVAAQRVVLVLVELIE